MHTACLERRNDMILPSTFIFKGGIEGETSMEHIIDVLKKSNINFFEAGFTQSGAISMESTPASLEIYIRFLRSEEHTSELQSH